MQDNISLFPSRMAGEGEQASTRLYVRLHNLPAQLTPLLGREQEIEAVSLLLRRPEVRLLTLTGVGGVGKTRLGLRIAEALLDDFADGVFFIPLAPISDPDLVIPTLSKSFGLKETADWSALEHLKAHLHEKHCLLLLDNFEQIIAAAPLLVELLQACPRLKLLVTSRTVLHVSGEQESPVPPLQIPDLKHLSENDDLMQYAAVALFIHRARAIRPDFQITKANTRALVEICSRLDGLPLAIELAAARVKLLPPQALLAQMEHRLQILTGGAQDAPVRQQTLRATLAWSYNLLDGEEQRFFQRLSVFVGGCTLDAVEAVCQAGNDLTISVLDGAASLIDKNLLQQTEREGEEPRLLMLETVREYAQECLSASGEEELIRSRHATYYLRLSETAETEIEGEQQARWLLRLEQEHENLRIALLWSVQQEDASSRELALRLAAALHSFWLIHGHLREGIQWLERTLARSEECTIVGRAKALDATGALAKAQGDYERAERWCQEALLLLRQLDDPRRVAITLCRLGSITFARGDCVQARLMVEEASAHFEQIGDKAKLAWSFLELAQMARRLGDYDQSRLLTQKSLALSREVGKQSRIADALFHLAEIAFLEGERATARPLLEESLLLFRDVDVKGGIADVLRLIGLDDLSHGDSALAHQRAQESLALFKEMGEREGIIRTQCLLARVFASKGLIQQARSLSEEGMVQALTLNDQELKASCMEGLACVIAAQGEGLWAALLWGASESLRDSMSMPIAPVLRADYEREVAAARLQVGERAFVAAWTQGRTMTPEQALTTWERAKTASPTAREQLVPLRLKTALAYPAGLTAREVEVLRLVAQGLSDAQVAEQLVISPRTVNWHLTSIYGKLQVSSRSAATRFAVEHRLV
jgi:predicted ATPase/DNA-binding CsgD family transcriptional regulator